MINRKHSARFLYGLAITVMLIVLETAQARAQFLGYAAQQTITQAFNITLTNLSAQYIINNYGQAAHSITFQLQSATVPCAFNLEGSEDGNGWTVLASGISSSGATNQYLYANGYFSYLRLNVNPAVQNCAGATLKGSYAGYQTPLPASTVFTTYRTTSVSTPTAPIAAYLTPTLVGSVQCTNPGTATAYLQLFDSATTPTLGTSVLYEVGIPAGQNWNFPSAPYFIAQNRLWLGAATSIGGSSAVATALTCNLQASLTGPFYPLNPSSSISGPSPTPPPTPGPQPLGISGGGTGTSSPTMYAGTGITISGIWPFQTVTNNSNYATLADPLPILHGGTGTATPSLVAGTGIAISGTWPGQTVTNNSAYATLADPLPVAHGGTGDTSLTVHGVVLGEATSPAAVTSAGTAGQPLLSGGASADPNWGILPVLYGGTGTATPSLTAGTGIAISGTWPGQTVTDTPYTTQGEHIPGGVSLGQLEDPYVVSATPSTTGGTIAAGTYHVGLTTVDQTGESWTNDAKVTTTGSTGSVILTWVPVGGATSYNVYFGSTLATAKFVATVTGGQSNTYTITSVPGSGAIAPLTNSTAGYAGAGLTVTSSVASAPTNFFLNLSATPGSSCCFFFAQNTGIVTITQGKNPANSHVGELDIAMADSATTMIPQLVTPDNEMDFFTGNSNLIFDIQSPSSGPFFDLVQAGQIATTSVATVGANYASPLWAWQNSFWNATTAPATVGSSTATTGGSIAGSSTVYYKLTLVNASGESLPSSEASQAVPAGTNTNTVTITSPAAGQNATGYFVYAALTTGLETLQGSAPTAIGTSTVLTALAATGNAPPASNARPNQWRSSNNSSNQLELDYNNYVPLKVGVATPAGVENDSLYFGSAVSINAGGTSQNVTLTPSGPSGFTILNGNVGIGTTAPASALHVVGSDRVATLQGAGGGANSLLRFNDGGTAELSIGYNSPARKFIVYDDVAAAYRMVIDGSGNVGIGTSTPSSSLFSVGASSQFQMNASGAVTQYNGLTVVANGIPSEGDQVNLAAQTAPIAGTNLLSSAAAQMYRVSCYVVVTTAATTSSTLPSCVMGWTDGDNSTPQSFTLTPTNTGNALTTFQQAVMVLNAKAATAITYSTTGYASSGATAMQYAIHIRLEAM